MLFFLLVPLKGKILQREILKEIRSVILNDIDEEEKWEAAKEANVTAGVVFLKKQI